MSFAIARQAFSSLDRGVKLTILVAALGYFVDVFDLLMFSIVRVQSLKSLGVPDENLLPVGITLINTQMAGLLLGGIVWGVWGDKLGRRSVLFGSIILYSLANLANGFVQSVDHYAILRFLAGVGLAGELGAGVTLASELLPRAWRGLGTTFIATIGVAGAVVAALVAKYTDWRTAYIIGGMMGLALLVLRLGVCESGMFSALASSQKDVKRGDLTLFLRRPVLLGRLIRVALVGAPTWALMGIIITFTPELAKGFGMSVAPEAGMAVLFAYVGIVIGDALNGLLSQKLRSRRKSILVFLTLTCVFLLLYRYVPHDSLELYYAFCLLLGLGGGIWAMFIQLGAEQFGTNIRATAASCTPNFTRALTIPLTMSFHALAPMAGILNAAMIVVIGAIILSMLCVISLRETFEDDLEYVER